MEAFSIFNQHSMQSPQMQTNANHRSTSGKSQMRNSTHKRSAGKKKLQMPPKVTLPSLNSLQLKKTLKKQKQSQMANKKNNLKRKVLAKTGKSSKNKKNGTEQRGYGLGKLLAAISSTNAASESMNKTSTGREEGSNGDTEKAKIKGENKGLKEEQTLLIMDSISSQLSEFTFEEKTVDLFKVSESIKQYDLTPKECKKIWEKFKNKLKNQSKSNNEYIRSVRNEIQEDFWTDCRKNFIDRSHFYESGVKNVANKDIDMLNQEKQSVSQLLEAYAQLCDSKNKKDHIARLDSILKQSNEENYMKDVEEEGTVSDQQVFNALYRNISTSHEFKKASGLKGQTYLQEWNDRETYYLLKGIYKHGENEWNDILCSFKFKDSRTPNCLAFKWRELKTVMVDEIERLKKEGISLSHFEWLEAALKKLEIKLKPASIARKASIPQVQSHKDVKMTASRVIDNFNVHQEAIDKILREYESKVATSKGLGHFGSFMMPTPNLTPQTSIADRPRQASIQDIPLILTHSNSNPQSFSQSSSNSNSNPLPAGNYQSSFVKRKNSDFTPIVGGMPGNVSCAAMNASTSASSNTSSIFANLSSSNNKPPLPTYVISGVNKFAATAFNSATSEPSKPFQANIQPINIKKLFESNSTVKTPKFAKLEDSFPSSPKTVAPTSPKKEAPSSPKIVAPSSPKIVAPSSPKIVAPSSLKIVAPSSPKKEAPSSPKKEAPSSPKIVAPSSPEKEAPSSPEKESPSFPQKDVPLFQREHRPTLISSATSMSSSIQKSEPPAVHSVSLIDKQSIINNYYISNSIQMNNFVNQHTYFCENRQQEKKEEEKKDKKE